MKYLKINFLILVIIALAFLLRFWMVDKYPVGLNADEAAIGYNAYSLIETGRDEYGYILPLSFKSFGDYKPGLYFYFVVPFIWLFGLSELAVRLPSVIFGTGTVFLIYLLGQKIFENRKTGIVCALLLTITPWHIHYSRGGWETNAATFFISLGVLFFIQKVGDPKYLFYSLLSFMASMYLYQSPRLVVPLLVIIIAVLYYKKILPNLKKFIMYFSILGLLSIPLIFQFASGGGSARFSGLSIFSDPGPANRVNELRGEHNIPSRIEAKAIHNKITAYFTNFLGHYLDHFSPNFLFINGDPIIRNKIPETGQFYLIFSLFLIIGIFGLITGKFEQAKLLFVWILTAPLASSLTYQTPNAVRAFNLVVPLVLVIGYGLSVVFAQIKSNHFRKLLVILFGVIILFETVHFLESYYMHYPKRYPLAWEYGFERMVDKLNKLEGGFEKVVITDKYDQPYILVLFYKQYDPKKYQPQAVLSERDKFNFGTVRNFDKYEFREINPDEVHTSKNTLFIGTEKEIPNNANIIDKIFFPNGEAAFVFAST